MVRHPRYVPTRCYAMSGTEIGYAARSCTSSFSPAAWTLASPPRSLPPPTALPSPPSASLPPLVTLALSWYPALHPPLS
eukprot:3842115-Rhodomonas_salina.2